MYLLPIQVPIYVDGPRRLLSTEWRRSLVLLRDSFAGKFGEITVVAPTLPAEMGAEQKLQEAGDGIRLVGGFDKRCRARAFWTKERAGWRKLVEELASEARVVHGGLDDLFRPIAWEGFCAGVRLGKPTVFVQDTDQVVQQKQLAKNDGLGKRMKAAGYAWAYERVCRWGAERANLSLLKGSALMARYGELARNAHEFQDTSYSQADIVAEDIVEQRTASLSSGRAIRLVYCGRLTGRKGVDRSLRIVQEARKLGGKIELDVIGEGSERKKLEEMGIEGVRFLGAMEYGRGLIAKLAEYDALLFTPIAEDTPRMIFDGYAAGLPLVGFGIPYVLERAQRERATVVLPFEDVVGSAKIVAGLGRELGELARLALVAADENSAERWYQKRAQWTLEAVGAR